MQPPQLRPRLQPQLLLQHPPRVLKALERVRRPAAPVEREHQLPPEPFSERILLDCDTELRHDFAMLAERKRRLELLLESIDSQRLQPPRLAAEPRSPRSALATPGRARGRAPEELTRPRGWRRPRATRCAPRPATPRIAARRRTHPPSARIRHWKRRSCPARARRADGRHGAGERSAVRRELLSPQGPDQLIHARDATAAEPETTRARRAACCRGSPPDALRRRPRTAREAGSREIVSSDVLALANSISRSAGAVIAADPQL